MPRGRRAEPVHDQRADHLVHLVIAGRPTDQHFDDRVDLVGRSAVYGYRVQTRRALSSVLGPCQAGIELASPRETVGELPGRRMESLHIPGIHRMGIIAEPDIGGARQDLCVPRVSN